MLQLRSLGELRLIGTDGEILAGRRKALVLLVYLARRSPAIVSREELAALLWGDSDDAHARHSLRQALLELKHVLGPVLDVGRRGITLRTGHVQLDAVTLTELLTAGRPADAVAHWRGDFLPSLEDVGGTAFRQWIEAEREGLRRQVAWALERLTADAERRAAWHEAADWAERWAALEPLVETPHRKLVEALHHDDRIAEALAQHVRFSARLRQDTDLKPSPEFTRLASEIQHSGRAEAALVPMPGSAALFTPDLIGREAELAELLSAWSAARDGIPTIVVLEGDQGLGKTRLAEAFLRTVEQSGDRVCMLRARGEISTETGREKWAVARALLAPLRAAPGLGGAPDRALADLSPLVPTLRRRFPNLPSARGGEPALEQALVRVLGDVASESPLLLFIDDLPAADSASARLIAALARQLPPASILLLTTAHDPDAPAVLPLRAVPGARRLRLRPLRAEEVEALIGSMLACTTTDRRDLGRRLHAEGGGNPMFVAEVVAALVEDGRLAPNAQGYWSLSSAAAGTPLPLPGTVREALAHRFERLDADARIVLATASQIRQPFSAAMLDAAAALPPTPVRLALDRLVAGRLLREAPGQPGHYAFTHSLVRRAAQQLPDATAAPSSAKPAHDPATSGVQAAPNAPSRWIGASRWLAAALLAAVIFLVAVIRPFDRGSSAESEPVLAIGMIRDYAHSDTGIVARALPNMLATNLARVPALHVVSQARMYEMLEQMGRPQPTAATLAGAARRAGARELIEGELYHPSAGVLRLQLRHVDLETGRVREVYTVDAADVFTLVDDATQRVARDFSREPGQLHIAEATTGSLVAYRMYEEGLRAHYQGDLPTARRFFRAALAEDSVFGLAAYHTWITERELGLSGDSAIESRIHRLAERAPERERLLMRALWASMSADPALTAAAETLVLRFPGEPDGHLLLGRARMADGEFLSALPSLRQVIRIDSLSLGGQTARCRACDALSHMVAAYSLADSLAAAERVAREWIRRQPGSGRAWAELVGTLEAQDRFEEALAAQERTASLRAGNTYDPVYPAILAIRAGDFAAADRLLREHATAGIPSARSAALWFWSISLRHQGRLHEALKTARSLRRLEADSTSRLPPSALAEAQVLFELGRSREAAALFDSLASFPESDVARKPFAWASYRSWRMTHAATALAAAGDTAALAQMVDSIQVLAARSSSARDRRLHHYARGLLLSARGLPEAAAAELYRAVHSLPYGYARNNLELSRALLRLNRHNEAIAVLQPSLRGWIEVGGFYTTRPELHAQLGRAFEAARQPDSAVVHYRRVLHAWQGADPELHARRDSISARLTALERALRRRT